MAMKTSWHRNETKWRHCHPMHTIYNFWSRNILKTGEAKFHVLPGTLDSPGGPHMAPTERIHIVRLLYWYILYNRQYTAVVQLSPLLSLLQQFPTAFARKVIKSAVYKACSQQSVSQSVKTLIQVDKPQRDKVKWSLHILKWIENQM